MNDNYEKTEVCYLCGGQFADQDVNEDHIFQQQFIRREQPKEKGFDYAGTLLVHKLCNNRFGGAAQGPESICQKSIHLLEVLHSQKSLWKVRKDNPNLRILALSPASLLEFTDRDAAFFGISDGTNTPYSEISSGKFFEDKSMINPFQIPVNIALSTLAKSTAGFLVKRFAYPKEGKWRILSIPHYAQDDDFSFDNLFGTTKPLEIGIKLWIKPENNGWLSAYKLNRLLVFFCFEYTASDFFQKVSIQFQNTSCLFFHSEKLIDLVSYDWSKNNYRL